MKVKVIMNVRDKNTLPLKSPAAHYKLHCCFLEMKGRFVSNYEIHTVL